MRPKTQQVFLVIVGILMVSMVSCQQEGGSSSIDLPPDLMGETGQGFGLIISLVAPVRQEPSFSAPAMYLMRRLELVELIDSSEFITQTVDSQERWYFLRAVEPTFTTEDGPPPPGWVYGADLARYTNESQAREALESVQ